MRDKLINFAKKLVRSPIFYIVLGALVIDIMTKWIMVNHFHGEEGNDIWLIPNFLKVTLLYNTGAIFGMGGGELGTRITLIVIRAILAVVIPVVYLLKGQNLKMRYKVTIMLIYAGCLGNLIDGLFYWKPIVGFDGVVDWIAFSFFQYTFNLADSYVTVCVFLIIIFIIIDEIKEVVARNRRGEFKMTPEEYEKHLAEQKKHEDKNQK